MSGGYAELQKAIEEIDNPCSMHGYRTVLADSLHSLGLSLEEAEGYAATAKSEAENAESYIEECKQAADTAVDEVAQAQIAYQRVQEQLEELKGSTPEQADPLRSLGAVIMAVVGMQCAARVMAERARWA